MQFTEKCNVLCKMLKVYEWLSQKLLGIHFLFLSKNDINCCEGSSCKLMSFNHSTNSSHTWQVCCLLKYQ